MSEKFEILENHMEQLVEYEQYAETPKSFENIASKNAHEGEAVESEVEAVEEESFQNETLAEQTFEDVTSLKYQQVDLLVRHEMKENIIKQEIKNINVSVLSEQKNLVLEQVKKLQDLKDHVCHKVEELDIKLEIDKDEMQQLEKRVQYNGKIVEKLELFMKTVVDEHIKLKSNQQFTDVTQQKKKAFDMESYWQREISELKSAIAAKKTSIANGNSTDDLKKKNQLLKSEVLQRRERLEDLKQQRQQIDEKKKERVKMLLKEEEELEETTKNLKQELQRIRMLKNQKETEVDEHTKKLNLVIEKKRERLNASQKTAEEIKNKLQEINEEYNRLVSISILKEERNTALDAEKEETLTKLMEMKDKCQEKSKKWQEDTQLEDKKLEESEVKLTTLIKENDELNCHLETLKKQYVAIIDEKSDKLMLKVGLQEQLRTEEVLSEKVGFLDDKIEKKQKAIDELTEKIDGLPFDKRLQEMEKKYAYLESSTDYLSEKYENVKKQVDDVKKEVARAKDTVVASKKSLNEKEGVRDNLLKELKEIEDSPATSYPFQDLIDRPRTPSILKSPSNKKLAASPKKVKFEGVPSYESSESSEVGGLHESIVGKTFLEIFEEVRSAETNKPAKSVKRKLDSD